MSEESECNDSEYCIDRYCYDHCERASYISYNQQDDKDFQWFGLYACRIDERLIEESVYQLCSAHYRQQYCSEAPKFQVQADRNGTAVFKDQAENRTRAYSYQRTDVWYYDEYTGQEAYSERCIDIQSCNEP